MCVTRGETVRTSETRSFLCVTREILYVSLQIVMTLVGPSGKTTVTTIADTLGKFSGHCVHLVPGDHQYEPPQFTIVIGWNSIDHFFPTEFVNAREIFEWKMCLVHNLLSESCQLFSEVEDELFEEEDTVLVDAMVTLRDQLEVTKQLLHSRGRTKLQVAPGVTHHAAKRTAMTKDIAIDYIPTPLIRHKVAEKNPDIQQTVKASKSASNPIAPSGVFPPIQLGPALLQEEFQVPSELIEVSRKRPAESTEADVVEVPAKRQTRSSSKGKGKQKTSSTTVPPTVPLSSPLPSTSQDVPSTAVVPSGPPKKFVCTQCGHSTDRKNDFDNHMNVHSQTTYKCDICFKLFHSLSSRRTHVQTSHLGIKKARCPHTDCDWEDKDFGKLKVHLFDAHGEGEEAKCGKCDRKFDNWRSFTRHINSCGRDKNKKCPQCNKTFKDLEKLTVHVQNHHGTKGYSPCICDKCGKVFKNKDSLRTHKTKCT